MRIFKKIINKFLSFNNPVSRYSVKLKRNYRVRKFYKQKKKIIEVGGGKHPLNDRNLNIDINDYHTVDVVRDILQEGLPFRANEIDKIVSMAFLEHFSFPQISEILGEFYRVLKKGGEVEINVPSLNKIFQYYQIHGCDNVLLRELHGAQKDQYDIHLCVMDAARLIKELENIGFVKAKEVEYNYFSYHDKELMMRIIGYKR